MCEDLLYFFDFHLSVCPQQFLLLFFSSPFLFFSFTNSFLLLSQFFLFPSLHPVTLVGRSLIPIIPVIPLIPILSIFSRSRFYLADLSTAACSCLSDVPCPLQRQIRSSQLYTYDMYIWQFPRWEIINDVNSTCLNCSSLGEEVMQPGKASPREKAMKLIWNKTK